MGPGWGDAGLEDPGGGVLVQRGVGARDVVAREPGEGRLVARLRAAGHLGVRDPLRVDEPVDRADDLLRLGGGDAREVDGDAVVVPARAPELRLASAKPVDARG